MKWEYSVVWMFLSSVVIGYFITSSLLVNSFHDIKPSQTKFYIALWMALWMVIAELVMFPKAPYWIWLLTIVFIIVIAYMARKQSLVDDRQYLQAMIQHHSSAILTSDQILKDTKDPEIRKLASWISQSQQEEIRLMNRMLSKNL